jgi:hypothetical protein
VHRCWLSRQYLQPRHHSWVRFGRSPFHRRHPDHMTVDERGDCPASASSRTAHWGTRRYGSLDCILRKIVNSAAAHTSLWSACIEYTPCMPAGTAWLRCCLDLELGDVEILTLTPFTIGSGTRKQTISEMFVSKTEILEANSAETWRLREGASVS